MSKALNELKKATMASYLSKAGGRVRSATKISGDFEADHYKAMATANKHHPNMVTPGFEKDPEKLKKAETQMKVTGDLRDTFKRDAYNRIKGIARAGRLLAKEDVLNERNTESHPELWDTHELVHSSGKVLKKGDKVKTSDGTHKIVGFELPHHSGSTGRVFVHDKQAAFKMASYFPSVVDAKIRKKAVKEEAEQIDELKRSTVASYLSKAINRHTTNMSQGSALAGAAAIVAPGETLSKDELEDHLGKKAVRQMDTRPKGMNRALNRLAKENVEESALTGGREAGNFPHSKAGHSYDSLTVRRGVNYGGKPVFVSKKMNKNYEKEEQARLKDKIKKSLAKEEAEQIDEVSRSTIAKVATARYNQAQAALKQKDFGGYVKKMKKAIKAADATTPNTGWSPEDDKKNEEIVPQISAQEKYRQIKEAKIRARKGK